MQHTDGFWFFRLWFAFVALMSVGVVVFVCWMLYKVAQHFGIV